MWTDALDKRNAGLVLEYVERLLEIDDKVNFLNPTEYNVLCELSYDVKCYIKELLTK